MAAAATRPREQARAGTEPLRFASGGATWQALAPGADVLRRELLDHLADVDALPAATRFKRTVRRTLYRIALSDGRRVLLKVFRPKSPRDRILRAVLPCRARAEWTASRRLARRAVPASRAIALGYPTRRRWDLLAYLVIHLEPDALPPLQHLVRLGPSAEQRAAFVADMARFVRRFHDAGVRQHDLHTGNLLVRQGHVAPADRFVLIDLQRVRLGAPPGPRHRAETLAQLAMGLEADLPDPALVERFLRAYHGDRPIHSPHLAPHAVRTRIDRRRAVRLRSRARRCLVNSSQFAVERRPGRLVYHRRTFSADQILALVDRHADALAHPPHTVACRSPDLQIAWHPPPGWLARLLPARVATPGLRSYADAHRARLTDRTVPRAVAAVIWLRGPQRGASAAILTAPHPATPPPPAPDVPAPH